MALIFFLNLHSNFFIMASTVNYSKKGSKPKMAGKPKKKGGLRKHKNKGKRSLNLFFKIMIIIFILLLAAVIILSYINEPVDKQKKEEKTEVFKKKTNNEEKEKNEKQNTQKEEKGTKDKNDGKEKPISRKENISKDESKSDKESHDFEKSVVIKSIEGSWLSTMKGAVLTMKDFKYRIDFSGVDASQPIIGKFEVDGNKVIFKNSQDPCKDVDGVYKVEIERGNISFTCKKDGCTKRKNTLAADWEWFEN